MRNDKFRPSVPQSYFPNCDRIQHRDATVSLLVVRREEIIIRMLSRRHACETMTLNYRVERGIDRGERRTGEARGREENGGYNFVLMYSLQESVVGEYFTAAWGFREARFFIFLSRGISIGLGVVYFDGATFYGWARDAFGSCFIGVFDSYLRDDAISRDTRFCWGIYDSPWLIHGFLY